MGTLGKTKNGYFILDKYNSRNEVPAPVLKEAFSKVVILDERNYQISTVRFKKVIGYSLVVPASFNEDIVYAKRPGNNFLSRFIKNKSPIATHNVTFEISRIFQTNEWLLMNSYFGPVRQPEIEYAPDVTPVQEQFDFWNQNAFCWGYLAVIPGTLTKTCPWEP